MKRSQVPEILDFESKLEAATFRRAEALILLDHAVDTRNHATAKIARESLERAGAQIAAIELLLDRLTKEYRLLGK